MTCIMNPPFLHGIHIKIILKAIENSKEVIALSPAAWLKDPLFDLKKSTGVSASREDFNTLKSKLENLIFINEKDACKSFNSGQASDLGIQTYNKGGFNFNIYKNKALEKVLSFFKYDNTILSHLKEKGISPCVKIPHISSSSKEGIYITENKDIARSEKNDFGGNRTRWLNFKSEEEAENCRLSFQTNFWKWLVKTTCINNSLCKLLPYMGYEGQWTDEKFYKFFDLNEDEIKIIEKYSKKF